MAYTKTLTAVNQNELDEIGQKATDLALLREHRFSVPDSFVVGSGAFTAVVEHNKIRHKIDFLLSHIQAKNTQSLMNAYTGIRKAVNDSVLPDDIAAELKEMYESLAAEGVGLSGAYRPVRVIVSTNKQGDSENNDTIIQNIVDVKEFLVAVKEAWALAYLPSQLKERHDENYSEKQLRIALLVQVMDTPNVSAHAYSRLPEDAEKVYLQVYRGHLDLREKITKDYYAITKETLRVVSSEVHKQQNRLESQDGKLTLVELPSRNKEDKLIRRDLEELGRLTKKAERVLQAPLKAFFSSMDEKHTLLWVNRLGFGLTEPVEETEPEIEEPAESQFAHAEHAAEQAILEAAQVAQQVHDTFVSEEAAKPSSDVNTKLLDASLNLAMRVVERKYERLYGQAGDDFHEMITQLNAQNVFSRTIDAELLQKAHGAVKNDSELSSDEHTRAIEEITFLMGNA